MGNDVIFGNSQNDVLFGGAGNNYIHGGQGNDILEGGGPGNNVVDGGQGDNLLIWRGSVDAGGHDRYDGGGGKDTLELELTQAESSNAAVQSDIASFRTFLGSAQNATGAEFTFSSLGLTVSNFEQLVVAPDTNHTPTIISTSTTATGSLSELPNTTGSSSLDSMSGSIAFADQDLGDRHFASESNPAFTWSGGTLTAAETQALTQASSLTLNLSDSTGTGTGSVAWTYSVRDSALDFLAAGQTLTVSDNVTISDNVGASVTQTLVGTMTGVNDTPTFVGGSLQGSVAAPPASQITAVGADDLTAGNTLVNGLGGTAGFGTNVLGPTDDGSTGRVDLTSVFGSAGIDFFGHYYTSLYINNNGNITFNGPNSTFTPTSIAAGIGGPIIAPFWADVDTRGPSPSSAPGSNLVYYDPNASTGVMTITWDDVAAYNGYSSGRTPDAFQVQLVNEGYGNFDIVYRYQTINWLSGDVSGGADARAGYNAQDGQHSFELPQSGAADMRSLPTTLGNTGVPGVWVFNVRSGSVVSSTLTSSGKFSFDDPDLSDTHTVSVTPVGTTLGTLSPVVASDTTGTGFGGVVDWTYSVASSVLAGLGPRVESFDVSVDDHHGGVLTKRVNVTIVGSGDAAAFAGDTSGSVTEASGIGNAIPGTPTASGTLSASDAQGATTFQAQTGVAENYGTFSILSNGAWTYTLDNSNPAVDALNVGNTLHDLVPVTTVGGTTTDIDITISGANDAAVIFGDTTGWVVEAGGLNNSEPGVPVATGTLHASDVDSPATFQTQSNVAEQYGSFSIAANGAWTYTLDGSNAAVNALDDGDTLHDLFNVATADGTTQQMDITVVGTDRAPVIGAADLTGAVTDPGINYPPAGPPAALSGTLTVDNAFELYISTDDHTLGRLIATGTSWPSPVTLSPTLLTPGVTNYLHVVAHNQGGPGGLLGDFQLAGSGFTFADGTTDEPTNAADWKLSLTGFGTDYVTPADEGANGVAPWGTFTSISSASHWLWDHVSQATSDTNTEYFSTAIQPTVPFLTASGTIAFSDPDATDSHVVSAVAIGSTLGSLAVKETQDTTGTGTGGLVTWTYTVDPRAVAY
ncbi:MAG: VCBS domain-containing protein, partial [Alphaproteobacteria bacterium]|nr:VCBS domain-containing protein [Alphaproteobacteria bacterium]